MTTWQHTGYLWVLGVLLLPLFLFIQYRRWKKNVVKKNNYGPALQLLVKHHSHKTFNAKFILVSCALALVILAVANLRAPGAGANVSRKGIDIVFALDISKSMLATDLKPNRLERAKLLINKITEQWPDNRTGLVLFAGRAYMQMPLTYDYAISRTLVNNATPESVPVAGTAIGEAIKLSTEVFATREKKYKAVILITDGEDHGENALREVESLKDSGAILITIGMGSEQGTTVIDPSTNDFKKDAAGQTVISRLNAGLLKELASAGSGRYIHYTETAEVMAAVKQTLATLGTKAIADKSLVNYNTYYQWFLIAALALLSVELLLRETKRIRKKPAMAVNVLLLLLFVIPASAQKNTAGIASGNDLYKKGEYAEAEAAYNKALEKNGTDYKATYNKGNAQYRQNNFKEAAKTYTSAAENTIDGIGKSRALYNKGTALVKQQDYAAAVEAYKAALKLNPADTDCRFNLTKAMQQLKKQQQDRSKSKQKNTPQPGPPKNQPPKPQSRLNKQMTLQILLTIRKKEKEVQNRLKNEKPPGIVQPDKDW
jgi:tetratricopeptide (TPR) repeat protein